MIHPTLISMRSDLKNFRLLINRKYKNRVGDYADIITCQISAKLLEYKLLFEGILNLTKKDEIFYFKQIKAKLIAIVYLVNYIKELEVKNMETKNEKFHKFYLRNLKKCHKDIAKLGYYYTYYIAREKHSDDKFFLRLNIDLLKTEANEVIEIDCKSTTPYLLLFAKAEALFHFKKYLLDKIKSLNINTDEHQALNTKSSTLRWTASKTDLIELTYALHAAGVFNNGKATIKDIVDLFQDLSNNDLSNHNRIFHDIKLRKKIKTKHIDLLKRTLLQKINDTDYQLFDE